MVPTPLNQASDAPFLDPTEDLSPVHQALVDQIAKQKGGKQARNDLLEQYVSKAEAGQDTSQILHESYANQMAQAEQMAQSLANPPGEFDHVGGVMDTPSPSPAPQTKINDVGYPFGTNPSGGNLGTGDTSPTASPLGTGDKSATASPLGGAQKNGPMQMEVPQIDKEAYSKASQNFYRLLNARPTLEAFPDLEKPGLTDLGLALVFALVDKRHAGDILSVPFMHQQQKRNQAIQNIVSKYQLNEQDWKTAATLAKDVMDHTFQDLTSQSKERNDALQFNAGEQNKYDNLHFTQDQLNQRNTEKIDAAKKNLQEKLDRADDKKRTEIMSAYKGYLQLWPEDQYPGKAADLASASAESKLASAELAKKRAWQIGELTPAIKAEKTAGASYKQALEKYLPDRIALNAAALFQNQERFDFEVQRFYDAQDQRRFEDKVKSAEDASKQAKTELDKLKTQAKEAESDYREKFAHYEGLKSIAIGPDGQYAPNLDDKTKAQYVEAVKEIGVLYDEWKAADKVAKEAEQNYDTANAALDQARKSTPPQQRYSTPGKGKILDRAKKFVSGKRPKPMEGDVPILPDAKGHAPDVSKSAYDRMKEIKSLTEDNPFI